MGESNRIVLLTKELGDQLTTLEKQMINVRSSYDVLWSEVNRSKAIATSAELVMALKTPGDYQLAPGTYTGNFQALADGVTILGADLPPGRVQPGATAQYTFAPSDPMRASLAITGSRFLLRGVNVAPCRQDRAVITAGSTTTPDPLAQPDLVMLDRIEVIANPTLGGKRGVDAHTRTFTLNDSRVIGFLYANEQSQGFLSYNGPGPYNLLNSEIEGSGENIMFGGGDTKSPAQIPSDIKIIGNLIRKPLAWRAKPASVANSLEFKCGRRALVENNIIDGCWRDIQAGHMIVLTPRNGDGTAPWCVVEDITIRGNRTINNIHGYAMNISLTDNAHITEPTKRIIVERNLFEDTTKGFQILGGVLDYLKITDNTLPKVKYNLIAFDPRVENFTKTNLEFLRNVVLSGEYGASSPSFAVGTPTINGYNSPVNFTKNVIEKTPVRTIPWPMDNTVLAPGALAALLDENYHYKPGGAGW